MTTRYSVTLNSRSSVASKTVLSAAKPLCFDDETHKPTRGVRAIRYTRLLSVDSLVKESYK